MKKKKDAALEYMLALGIQPAKTPGGAKEQLEKVMDTAAFTALLKGEESEGDLQVFYRMKNQNLKTALTVSGAFGGDVLRKACGFIDANPSLFAADDGGAPRILEIGCDCGAVSCFLGRRFPEAQVTGTDLCAEAVAAAGELARQLGLTNVSFVKAEPDDGSAAEGGQDGTEPAGPAAGSSAECRKDMPEPEYSAAEITKTAKHLRYDVVFSLRTMHENCDVEEDPEQHPAEYRMLCEKALKNYAAQIAGFLKPGGRLVSIERYGSIFYPDAAENPWEKDALLLAYVTALHEAGVETETEKIRELKCMEVGQENRFHVLTAVKK